MYELWDSLSLNMIDCYRSAAQAESASTNLVRTHGPEVLDPLFLLHENANDESTLIAEGQAMLVAIRRLVIEERTAAEARRVG